MSADDDDTGESRDDYRVGYRRPPRHTQFKPGQSGNPRGRRKGSRGIRTDLHAELNSKLTIQINGRPVSATKQQLMLKTLAARAASGDVRAAGLLLPLIIQVFGYEDRGAERQTLSPQDQEILDALLRSYGPEEPAQVAAGEEPELEGDGTTDDGDVG